ncbi:MAG: cytochrome c oxidase subunit II [Bacteroidetes bacterium]|nr:cytochrome c oxidase subunit II [Bacteroidota bacterium]
MILAGLLDAERPSIFNTASPEAEKIGAVGNGFLIGATAMFLLVAFLTVYICVRYRAKAGNPEPKQTSGNRKVEMTMVGIPFLMVIFFFFWSMKTMSAVLPPRPAHAVPDIIITGHQYWWQADYPAGKFSTANEIHLPVGRKLLVELRGADVIHDWWVPALGEKMDMIPGTSNYLWMTITKPGTYLGSCSEFCGEQHAWMRITVIAQQPEAYQRWLAGQAATGELPADTMAARGAALFMHASCSSCHSIRGTTAIGTNGPDLTHFAGRQTMLTGMLKVSNENIYRWLLDPQKVKPGAHMPRFIFPKDSLLALTAYLSSLK